MCGQACGADDGAALVKKIQGELGQPVFPSQPDPAIRHGEFLAGTLDSTLYPGPHFFRVYVPAQYDPAKPACLLVRLDGIGALEGEMLDELIARKDVPVIIAVGIAPGSFGDAASPGASVRHDRSFEFDSVNDHFPDYVLNELLPAVEKLKTQDGRPIASRPTATITPQPARAPGASAPSRWPGVGPTSSRAFTRSSAHSSLCAAATNIPP